MIRRGGRLSPSTRRALWVLPVWITLLAWMWSWWLDGERIANAYLYFPLTLALIYEFALLPSIFIFFLFKVKYPAKRRSPKGKKVAVITLCVPSKESVKVIEKQLEAMSKISYPHDSWILDEGNSIVVKRLAKKYGVKHFSRKGVAKYNQAAPPFKAKTKAGNVNAWLEHVKRRKYEYFVQFDIDHLAHENYLDKTLGHFRDKKVAWVQAPSVYKNHDTWTALGSSEQELVLQGPLQMGFYGYSQTPFIIGSHCTYRMDAVREIGGFQPTRAEDHLDTLLLAGRGYRGVFVPEVIAEGDGPENLETYLSQQFAWAYSMFQVLTKHTPHVIRKLNNKQKFQFLFSQTWYPLWSLSYLVTFMVPVISLITNKEVASLPSNGFAFHFLPLFACSFLVWWCAKPIMQPANVSLSWRGMLLHVVRWPIVLLAVLNALLNVKKSYMITPKGKGLKDIPSINTYRPFLALGLLSASSVIYATLMYGDAALRSQIIFALTNSLFMLTICFVDLNIRLRKVAKTLRDINKLWLKPVGATAMVALIFVASIATSPFVNSSVVSAIGQDNINDYDFNRPLQQQSTEELLAQLRTVTPINSESSPQVGIYSPKGSVPPSDNYIRHIFVTWQNPHYLAEQLLIAERQGATPLVTLEPRGVDDGQQLLSGISKGEYDERLDQINQILAASPNPVYIRFAHEMELADLYPWGGQDPQAYIAAYKHVVDRAKNQGATKVKWVWSPAGNAGAESYYPGDKYVDVVGTTVLYDDYWYGGSEMSFHQLAAQREWLTTYDKPVWVVEFGVGTKSAAFQEQLISDGLTNYKQEGFDAIVYLNIPDANISGPDYRIHDPKYFASQTKLLEQTNTSNAKVSKQTLPPRKNKQTNQTIKSSKSNSDSNESKQCVEINKFVVCNQSPELIKNTVRQY